MSLTLFSELRQLNQRTWDCSLWQNENPGKNVIPAVGDHVAPDARRAPKLRVKFRLAATKAKERLCMSRRRMNTKEIGPEKGPQRLSSASRSDPKVSTPSAKTSQNYLLWILVAIALAGASYMLTRSNTVVDTAQLARLPESYGLCSESGRIYTVDDDQPTVDCILVHKDEIMATGSRSKPSF